MRGHRRLRNRVAAPGRARREPLRRRRGSGSWPARHCACVSTTRAGAGVEAFDYHHRWGHSTLASRPLSGREGQERRGSFHAFVPALATGRDRGAGLKPAVERRPGWFDAGWNGSCSPIRLGWAVTILPGTLGIVVYCLWLVAVRGLSPS